jgi:signal transduction histidine kinase
LAEDELKIYRRFTSVLSLTYKRYRDLRNAEARAKEAVRQASLDRLRAEIASMRTAADLDRITPLIWKELTTLGIPFVRCGVFIMDEPNNQIHTYLSTPDGRAIAAFHLPLDNPGNLGEAVQYWREHKAYVTRWVDKDFQAQADLLAHLGAVDSRDQYLSNVPTDGIYLHLSPFRQGMLYVGNTAPLSDAELDLVQSLSDAFSVAYARYDDFRQLEMAKKDVENALTGLKQAQQQLVQSEKMASLGELTAGIAHEIQNPLNFVNNFAEVNKELLDEIEEERRKEKGERDEHVESEILNAIRQNLEKINFTGKGRTV